MASTSTLRKNNHGPGQANNVVLDLETRAKKGDHQALRLWLRLLSCTVRIENKIRLRLRREFSTTLPRFDLMAQLERNTGGLRMNELSERLMVSGGNVTGITDQLEREGLVSRTPCPGDRRAFTVKLTGTGLKRFRQMAAQHELWIIELLGGLGRDEKETMINELGKVKAHINRTASPTGKANQRLQPNRLQPNAYNPGGVNERRK